MSAYTKITIVSTPTSESPTAEELLIEYNNQLRHGILPLTVIFGIEICVGVFGNLLTLFVFLFRYKSCNFRYFVLSLAFIDFISCITTIPGEMVSQIFWYDYPVPPVCLIKDFFNQFTVCSDAGCLTLIAVDRYRKVCKPFGWQIKQKTAIIACAVIYVVAAVLAIPTQILWGVRSGTLVYKDQNITFTVCEKAQKYADSQLPFAYAAFNGCLVFITLICMFVLYVFIVRKLILFKARKQKISKEKEVTSISSMEMKQCGTSSDTPLKTDESDRKPRLPPLTNRYNSMNKAHKPDAPISTRVRRKTIIMFYLTLIFIITIVIYYALISALATGVLAELSDSGKVAYFFFLRLYFINHAINPILYGYLDPLVRQEVRKMKTAFLKSCCLLTDKCRQSHPDTHVRQ